MRPWLLGVPGSKLLSDSITAVSGCTLCLVADEGITLTSGKVSQWSDKSGSGNSATQSNSILHPTLTTNSYNGKAGVTFSSSTLILPNFPILPFTFLAVAKASLYNGLIDTAPGTANAFRIGPGSGSSANYIDYWDISPAFNLFGLGLSSSTPALITTGGTFSTVRNVAAYVNGTALSQAGNSPSSSNTVSISGSVAIGSINGGSAAYYSGDILCMAAWGRWLSSTERTSIEATIRSYYGF